MMLLLKATGLEALKRHLVLHILSGKERTSTWEGVPS
jgi:hypothetical protein